MGFLIKTGFWLGLVLVMIPRNDDHGTAAADNVGPLQVIHTASEVVKDFSGICERKPDVCTSAGAIIRTVGTRAKDGAAIAYDAITSRESEPDHEVETGSTKTAD